MPSALGSRSPTATALNQPHTSDGAGLELRRQAAVWQWFQRSLSRSQASWDRCRTRRARLLHPFCILDHILDRTGHQEGLLRQLVVLALEDLTRPPNRLLAFDVPPGAPGELLGNEHRLAHVAL